MSAQKGFTLIELTVIILIVSIISIYVGVNWPEQTINLRSQADRLAGDIRESYRAGHRSVSRYSS